MIIYSWNMFFENKKLDEALTFISTTNFDVFCLQEVPQAFLDELFLLPYSLAYVQEVKLTSRTATFPVYTVIISKHEIQNKTEIPFEYVAPTVGSIVVRGLIDLTRNDRVVAWEGRHALFAEIEINSERYQIFSIHLPLTFPAQRMKELEQIVSYRKEGVTSIICGDFNTVEKLSITVINWLMGGSFLDWILYKRERKNLEKYFENNNLINPLRGHNTHPISSSQLDAIIVPSASSIKESHVIRKSYGSDHKPITIEIA